VYALVNDKIYSFFNLIESEILTLLESLFPSLGVDGPWLIISLAVALIAIGVWRFSSNPYYLILSLINSLAWVAFLPAILYFSNIDWIELAGLVSNNATLAIILNLLSFQTQYSIFGTTLPLWQVLGIGSFITSFAILLPFGSGAKRLRLELIGRGASYAESQRITLGVFSISLAVISIAVGIVFLVTSAGSLLASRLAGSTSTLPYPYFVLGFVAAIAIGIAVVAYLRSSSRGQIVKPVQLVSS
jgi:hypothetical protein